MNYINEYVSIRHSVEHCWHDPQLVFQLGLGCLERRLSDRGVSLFVLSSCAAIGHPDGTFCIDSFSRGIADIVIDTKQIRETANALRCTLREVAQSAVLHECGHLLNIKLARAVDPSYLPSNPVQEEERAWFLGKKMAESLGVSVPHNYGKVSKHFIKSHSDSNEKQSVSLPSLAESRARVDRLISQLEKRVEGLSQSREAKPPAIAKSEAFKPVAKERHQPSTPYRKALTPQEINAAKAQRLGIVLPANAGNLDKDRVSVNMPSTVLCFG